MSATFLQLQQNLATQVGMDQTISSNATLLKRWLNKSQQRILRAFEWPFNRAQSPLVIQTTPDYTTGTIVTTAGSTSITFSTVPKDINGNNVSVANYYLQTSSSNDWYKIVTHTSGTTTATLEIAAIYTSATATVTIRKTFYTTSSAVDRIIQINQSVVPYQLVEVSPEYYQSINSGFLGSGPPRVYLPAGLDSSGFPQFRLWPNPDAVINLYIDYLKTATDMVADGDTCVIPDKWSTTILVEGGKCEAFEFLDDSQQETTEREFKEGIEEMKTEYETSLHRHRVMTAADQQPMSGGLGYLPLPFNYPRGS